MAASSSHFDDLPRLAPPVRQMAPPQCDLSNKHTAAFGCAICRRNFCASCWDRCHFEDFAAHQKGEFIRRNGEFPCTCLAAKSWKATEVCSKHDEKYVYCTDKPVDLSCRTCKDEKKSEDKRAQRPKRNFDLIANMATEKREALQAAIDRVEPAAAAGKADLKAIGKMLEDVETDKQRAIAAIEHRHAIIQQLLDTRKAKLLQEVNEFAAQERAGLQKQEIELAGFVSKAEAAVECTNTALHSATDLQILSSADPSHLEPLQQLNQTKPQAAQPPVQIPDEMIRFEPMNLDELATGVDNLLSQPVTDEVLIELVSSDSPLLVPELLKSNSALSEGARNALILLTTDSSKQPLDDVLRFLDGLSRPWSRHGSKLLGLMVGSSSGELELKALGEDGCKTVANALKINSTLTTLHLRSNQIADAGCTAIADALKINSTLTTLELSDNQVGDAGCTAIADALKINSTLTTLGLGGNRIGDAGCTAIGDALKINSTLTELDLSSNQIGVAGCTAIADALKINSTLTTLELWGNQVGVAGCTAIADALKINSTLTTLGLSDNQIGVAGCTMIADALKINSTLTFLGLSSNQVGDAGCTVIGDALKVNSTLTTLLLPENQVGDAGCTAIGDALKINSTLTTLDLSRNRVADAGCAAIADALKINSTLTTLLLPENQVGDAGCTLIGDALKVNSTLTDLGLFHNQVGDAGCTAIADALKINSTLTTLLLPENQVGDAGCTLIGDALKVNSTLTDLGLFHNQVGDAGCTAIADALKINSTLTTLLLPENQVGDAGCAAIADALKINSTLATLDLSRNRVADAKQLLQSTWGSRGTLKL